MQRVPVELLTDILGYLPNSDLRNAAIVDTQLYRAAQDAGCYIYRMVDIARPDTVATFQQLVDHATSKPPLERPGIALRLFADCSAATQNAIQPVFRHVLDAIEAAMPLLVRLEAHVPSFFADDLHQTLCAAPAPRLRRLALGQAVDGQSTTVPLPIDLFRNTAPRLRSLCLALPTLEAHWQPVSVFQHVRTVQLNLYRIDQPIAVAPYLPHPQSLTIDLTRIDLQEHPQPQVNLSGLVLRRLTIDGKFGLPGSECVVSGIDITKVPLFECGPGTAFTDRFWESAAPSNEPISALFEHTMFLSPGERADSITLKSAGCTRTAFSVATYLSPIGGAPDIGTRLTTVVLDALFLSGLLGVETPLLALAELYIDVTGFSTLSLGRVRASYPSLELVALFAREKTFPLHSHGVAALGEMLNLGVQSAESCTLLKMIHVGFVQPMARERLRRVFPVIKYEKELNLKPVHLVEPRDSLVERPVFVPDFVFRNA